MSRKRREPVILQGVEIADVAAEGKAVARVDNLVIFVPYAVPGDVVDLRVLRKKHSFAEAEIVRFHRRSETRAEPFCQHFGVCGGCKWQCLPYAEQLRYKQREVMGNLQRIGKVELPECMPILGSQLTRGYRNKLEFGCSSKEWKIRRLGDWEIGRLGEGIGELGDLGIRTGEQTEQTNPNLPISQSPNLPAQPGFIGFHAGGAFDKILPICTCHLMDPVNDRLRLAVRDYGVRHGLTFYDARQRVGLLRNIMIRTANTGGLMLLVQFCILTHEEREQAMALMGHLADEFPQLTSLLWVNNTKCNDTFGDLPVQVFRGDDHITMRMDDLLFKVRAKSFYQTNTEQAHVLYQVARDFAGLTGGELVYDLYTGTGTIANFVARRARQVVGIEYVPDAIEDAKENSRLNGIDNTLFYAGDMKDILNADFLARHGRPDVIITDPPRAGMHPGVVQTILDAAPRRIVYVSCNSATQARDLSLLDPAYRVAAVQPVDMFPHTHHVENVVLLVKR